MRGLPHHTSDAAATSATPSVDDLARELSALRTELRQKEAAALESARLFAQARARLVELSALNRVSRAVVSTLDVNELLCVALRQAVLVTRANTGSIMLLEPQTNLLKIVAAHGLSESVVTETAVPVGEGLAGWVAARREPLLVSNVAGDPRFHLVSPRAEVRSAMSVPLLTPKDMLGVINVARTATGKRFAQRDLQLLGTVAGQIALAVDNARLFEAVSQRNEELSVLTHLADQLSRTLNLREVLEIIVDQSCAILRADAAAVFLLDERNDVLRARATRNVAPGFQRRVRGHLGEGVIGDVALTGRPAYVQDVRAQPAPEHAHLPAETRLRSMLCVPLSVGGRGAGAVAIYTHDVHHWTDHDLNLFLTIAGQSALALHNARNYQDQRGIADLVQKNLIPRMELGRDDVEIGHRYLPAKKVGGDYYDVFRLTDGRLAVLIADVAGKSVQAAVHTAKGKYFIRALGFDSPSPADVLRRANALIYADTAVETFISAFYAVLESDRRTLRYCNAGHPPPIIIRVDGRQEELGHADILLGVLSGPAFTEHTVSLEPGDTLVLTTDGVTEARSAWGLFGQEGLHSCLERHPGLTPQGLANAVVEDTLAYADAEVRDDIAVLVLRIPS